MPRKLSAVDPEDTRRQYKIVDRRTMADVGDDDSLILSASEESGNCLLRYSNWAVQEHNLGPEGLRITPKSTGGDRCQRH